MAVQNPLDWHPRKSKAPKDVFTKPGRINATAALSLASTGYRVPKIHQFSLQSESDAQTVYFYDVVTGVQISQAWVFNAREGVISPFSKEALIVPQAPGHDIGLNLANATYVNYFIQYTNEDETLYRV